MIEFSELSQRIWDSKYRWREAGVVRDATIQDTWRRIAHALAGVEQDGGWEEKFYAALGDFRFLPGGRIQAGAGTGHNVTLFNCFVMGAIEDSMPGIFEALKEGALTMQQGGGVGYDFSTLRPAGTPAQGVGMIASGPVSFMRIWDSMCATILSTGARRGAMMGTLRCDHPDIEAFIDAKRDGNEFRNFNLSVLVSDAFMHAVAQDDDWALRFPIDGPVHKQVNARELWRRIMRAAYDCAEPGVIFIDRVNRGNNLAYCETIHATNPCGEVPLPAYGACDLGSINLTRFVEQPFTPGARLDLDGIAHTAAIATRMLDNVYDLSHFPLPQQHEVARASRRIGLGLTGLADACIMLGVGYGSEASLIFAEDIMRTICLSAYRTSIGLAREKGAFPLFRAQEYLQGEFVQSLPQDIRQGIAQCGIRNSHLTSIAPAGTISLLANTVSSGLEPVFAYNYLRKIRQADGSLQELAVSDYAWRLFRNQFGSQVALPPGFVKASEVGAEAQLSMQAALQKHVDNAISKTVTLNEECDFEAFVSLYEQAYRMGLKGCTAFRPNPVTGQVLEEMEKQCCSLEREAD